MSVNNTHLGAEVIRERLARCHSLFFIGAGGINMSSLALISKKRGYRVGGSDRTRTALTKRLEDNGIEMYYTHDAAHVKDYDAVVYTVAISPDNPEYRYACENGLLCVSRADYLGYVMTGYRTRVGVCGMHGKSTCTSMCAQTFMNAGVDPTVLSGAEMASMDGAYRIGKEDFFVFEACEYMDSFLDFNPTVAILLNIEREHVDYFHSMEQTRDSFARFIGLTGADGVTVANLDDENVRMVLSRYTGRVVTFGCRERADFTASRLWFPQGCPDFDILYRGEPWCHVTLAVPGEHNVYNALACAAASYVCGLSPNAVTDGLASFAGAKRRLERKGTLNGAAVFDDYGHHPTEVKTTLDGVARMGYRRLFCVFQSHTYTRTRELFDQFMGAFDSADQVIFADIYPARETDTLGMSGEKLADSLGEKGHYLGGFEAIAAYLQTQLIPGDVLVVMGAGNVEDLFAYLPLT